MNDKTIVDILEEAGFETVEGGNNVRNAIGFDFSKGSLCSGYRVFPDGRLCLGCEDCIGEEAIAHES